MIFFFFPKNAVFISLVLLDLFMNEVTHSLEAESPLLRSPICLTLTTIVVGTNEVLRDRQVLISWEHGPPTT